jgi:hypothetical protein
MENGTTILPCDLRKHALHQEVGTKAPLWWRQASSHVDVHALSTLHHPMTSRCLIAQGSSLDDQPQQSFCTPEITGVSTSQPMRHSVIRLACSLAVVCGVSLRHMALLFSALFLMPVSTSSITRWMDAIGTRWPTPEEMLRHLLPRPPATACHMDGSYPLGTDTCVLVVKDEHDRILMTHDAASEHGEDARQCLPHVTDLGLHVTAAVSDSSHSFTEAIKAVWPQARWQADHCHTAKHIWGYLKKSLFSSRRQVKARGEAQNDERLLALAKP